MKKLFSLFTLTILAFSAVYAEDCVATYGVASVTFTRDGAQYKTGHFSVSADKTVKFAPGNLAYSTSTAKFYFLENQYSYLHREEGYDGTATGEIDLFGYGASGGTVGDKTVSPSCKDNDDSSYASGDLVDEQSDWGVHNDIEHTKGEQTTTYKAGTWRTLTWDEWNYVSFTRTNARNLIGAARVYDIYGLILLPDDWTYPTEQEALASGVTLPTFVPSFSFIDVSGDNVNVFSADQWNKLYEAHGAVFLPAVGNSGGYLGTDTPNSYCCYWSSIEDSSETNKAYRADFGYDDRKIRLEKCEKKIRSSVRLVQDY